jgi:hypothetical protein
MNPHTAVTGRLVDVFGENMAINFERDVLCSASATG